MNSLTRKNKTEIQDIKVFFMNSDHSGLNLRWLLFELFNIFIQVIAACFQFSIIMGTKLNKMHLFFRL